MKFSQSSKRLKDKAGKFKEKEPRFRKIIEHIYNTHPRSIPALITAIEKEADAYASRKVREEREILLTRIIEKISADHSYDSMYAQDAIGIVETFRHPSPSKGGKEKP